MEVDDELQTLLSEQRRELTVAITGDSDLDFAFQLQMQEVLTASLSPQPSSSSSSLSPPLLLHNDDSHPGLAHLLAEEIEKFDQERSDREIVEKETRQMLENFNVLIHDQVFARQIRDVPADEWIATGDWFQKPYGEVSFSNSDPFRVYFKGLVNEETVGNEKMVMAGIGVAICDTSDCVVFELRKPLIGGETGSNDIVEVNALIEGLNAAVALGLKNVHIFCEDNLVYQYLTGKWISTETKIVPLIDQLSLLQRKFAYCRTSLIEQKDIKYAVELAKDAIVSQTPQLAENIRSKTLIETCEICVENIYVGQMFSVDYCHHRYCFSCMRRHVEAQLLQAKLPTCPHEGCKYELQVESCKKFLNPELYDIMSQRIKEASIPATQKIYCPYPNCSALMSKAEIQGYAETSSVGAQQAGIKKCIKCDGSFCINCKVAWHDNMTCVDYKRLNPYPSADEAKLKSLATMKRWRECVKCNNMVELAAGCYHIYCRCGYQFCYTCGAEWINKKPTCSCPIWDEHNIIN